MLLHLALHCKRLGKEEKRTAIRNLDARRKRKKILLSNPALGVSPKRHGTTDFARWAL